MKNLRLTQSARFQSDDRRASFARSDDQFERTWSAKSTTSTDNTFHQLAPYIGRLKTSIARSLISRYARAGDLVVDPFSGGGAVALEPAASSRRVLAGDWTP